MHTIRTPALGKDDRLRPELLLASRSRSGRTDGAERFSGLGTGDRGFVFVDEGRRGNRISQGMIEAALRYAGSIGYETVYLMSGERGLYEKYGFTKLGDYDTIYGTRDQLFSRSTSDPA